MGLRQLPAEPQNLQPPPSALSDAAPGRKRSNESNETAPLPLPPSLSATEIYNMARGRDGSHLVNHLGICFPLNILQGGRFILKLRSAVNYLESKEKWICFSMQDRYPLPVFT